MLGLGEEIAEVREVLRELAGLGCDIVTLGQYLRLRDRTCRSRATSIPTRFAALRDEALALGISHVESGPLVRSSYHADGQAEIIAELRARTAGPQSSEVRPSAGPQA